MSLCRVSSWEVIAKSGNSRQEAQEAQQKVMFPHHLRLFVEGGVKAVEKRRIEIRVTLSA